MNVFLLLYLCTSAARTDCQVFPVQRWMGPDSYQQCGATARQLTADLTGKNRKLNYFVCDIQAAGDVDAAEQSQPPLHRQSFQL
ncbi:MULTISPECIES: hypothetical protein [unclassified Pseudomonas]|uniref:hypothetical protein n=1 Tax=unclassified Pseudomonas TaxID=196821 RepID=UPI000A1F0800|nr:MULTISPECIES: hypothetical protein [unclassified Pseudomonas]